MCAPRSSRAFTLAELMVAVLILIVVIVATSRMFGTVSKVTGVGQAGAAVLQEAAAIERQIRSDFERLSREGFFVIRCVAVPNDVNLNSGGALLNPSLPSNAIIRADQLLFFAHGVQTIQTLGGAAGVSRKGQGTVSRIYYGPAFQLPEADAVPIPDPTAVYVEAQDPRVQTGDPVLVPWYRGPHDMVRTVFQNDPAGSPANYTTTNDGSIDATQPPASRWLLARHAVVLVGDGGYPESYETGFPISGLGDVDEGITVFQAGTKTGPDGEVLTSGGRVLAVTAMGKTLAEAREKVYANISRIHFEGCHYRKDIALIKEI